MVSHLQNNSVKEVEPTPYRSSLYASLIAVRSKVTKTVSEKQLLRNNSAARQSIQLRETGSISPKIINTTVSIIFDLPALDLS